MNGMIPMGQHNGFTVRPKRLFHTLPKGEGNEALQLHPSAHLPAFYLVEKEREKVLTDSC